MILVSSCSCLCPIHWSQVLSRELRCSWGSADRRCSNYIWVINNFIAFSCASYIRGLTVYKGNKMDISIENQYQFAITIASNSSIHLCPFPYIEFVHECYQDAVKIDWINLINVNHICKTSRGLAEKSNYEIYFLKNSTQYDTID